MNQTTTRKPTLRPPARSPRGTRAQTPSRARHRDQEGRSARARLTWRAGAVAIALGWAFVIAAVLMPKDAANFVPVLECAIAGAGLLGFGAGWCFRDEGGGR